MRRPGDADSGCSRPRTCPLQPPQAVLAQVACARASKKHHQAAPSLQGSAEQRVEAPESDRGGLSGM